MFKEHTHAHTLSTLYAESERDPDPWCTERENSRANRFQREFSSDSPARSVIVTLYFFLELCDKRSGKLITPAHCSKGVCASRAGIHRLWLVTRVDVNVKCWCNSDYESWRRVGNCISTDRPTRSSLLLINAHGSFAISQPACYRWAWRLFRKGARIS
jgi:hypothetical protein